MSVEAADRYVAAGAALLDEKGPENWRETLYAQREKLRVDSLTHCPLGILYGSYWGGMDALGAVENTDFDSDSDEYQSFGAMHGFEHSDTLYYIPEFEDENDQADYSELLDAWLDVIEPEVDDGSPE